MSDLFGLQEMFFGSEYSAGAIFGSAVNVPLTLLGSAMVVLAIWRIVS